MFFKSGKMDIHFYSGERERQKNNSINFFIFLEEKN